MVSVLFVTYSGLYLSIFVQEVVALGIEVDAAA